VTGFPRLGDAGAYAAVGLGGLLAGDTVYRIRGGKLEVYPYVAASNPRTAKQQQWRGVFADGAARWRDLTESARMVYHGRAARRGGRTGFNVWMSDYLLAYGWDS
jgi:hypothetical protein